jgi:hypothetical protein
LVSVEVDSLTRSKRCAFRALDRDVSVNAIVARLASMTQPIPSSNGFASMLLV